MLTLPTSSSILEVWALKILPRCATHADRVISECNIHDIMQDLIGESFGFSTRGLLLTALVSFPDEFFVKHLSLSVNDATMLHRKYYREYGLAIEGLTRHHKIDPLEFNREVDDALPLDDILKPDPKLRKLLEDIDRTKVKLWLLTNAYVNHAKRVVRLLGVDDLFEGVTYCDYSKPPLVCKPNQDMYEKAEKEAGVPSTKQCYFVGMCPYRVTRCCNSADQNFR